MSRWKYISLVCIVWHNHQICEQADKTLGAFALLSWQRPGDALVRCHDNASPSNALFLFARGPLSLPASSVGGRCSLLQATMKIKKTLYKYIMMSSYDYVYHYHRSQKLILMLFKCYITFNWYTVQNNLTL